VVAFHNDSNNFITRDSVCGLEKIYAFRAKNHPGDAEYVIGVDGSRFICTTKNSPLLFPLKSASGLSPTKMIIATRLYTSTL
jgi:hypothetical protein